MICEKLEQQGSRPTEEFQDHLQTCRRCTVEYARHRRLLQTLGWLRHEYVKIPVRSVRPAPRTPWAVAAVFLLALPAVWMLYPSRGDVIETGSGKRLKVFPGTIYRVQGPRAVFVQEGRIEGEIGPGEKFVFTFPNGRLACDPGRVRVRVSKGSMVHISD